MRKRRTFVEWDDMPRCSPRGRASFFSLLAFHCDVGVHRDPSVGLYLFQVYCFLWLSWYARVWRGRGPLDGWSEVRVEVRAVLHCLTLVLVCGLLWLSLCAHGVGVGLEMVGVRCESRSARLFLASLMASLSFCISNRLAHRCMKHNERARVAPLDFF